MAWHGICSMHAIVTVALPHIHAYTARATGEEIVRTLDYTTQHPLTDIDLPAATAASARPQRTPKWSSRQTERQRNIPVLNIDTLETFIITTRH